MKPRYQFIALFIAFWFSLWTTEWDGSFFDAQLWIHFIIYYISANILVLIWFAAYAFFAIGATFNGLLLVAVSIALVVFTINLGFIFGTFDRMVISDRSNKIELTDNIPVSYRISPRITNDNEYIDIIVRNDSKNFMNSVLFECSMIFANGKPTGAVIRKEVTRTSSIKNGGDVIFPGEVVKTTILNKLDFANYRVDAARTQCSPVKANYHKAPEFAIKINKIGYDRQTYKFVFNITNTGNKAFEYPKLLCKYNDGFARIEKLANRWELDARVATTIKPGETKDFITNKAEYVKTIESCVLYDAYRVEK